MVTEKPKVQHTATVGAQDTTISDIQAAAKAVGAPTDARVTTGGYYQPYPNDAAQTAPYSITFTWVE